MESLVKTIFNCGLEMSEGLNTQQAIRLFLEVSQKFIEEAKLINGGKS